MCCSGASTVTHSIAPGNTITVANTANKTQAITLQDLKFLSSGNKCFLPITLKDGSNNDQQIMAQIDTKNLVLPGTYLQMKVDPQQITTVDGQQVVQLTSAANLPTSISLAQPHYVQTQQQSTENIQQATIVPETRTIYTAGGQNITITQVSQPILVLTSMNRINGQLKKNCLFIEIDANDLKFISAGSSVNR